MKTINVAVGPRKSFITMLQKKIVLFGVQVGLLVMIPRALYEILGHWPFGINLCQVGGGTGRL